MPAASREAVAIQMLRAAWLAAQPSTCKLFPAKLTNADEDWRVTDRDPTWGYQNSKPKGAGPAG